MLKWFRARPRFSAGKIPALKAELTRVLNETGLTAENDTMPLDEGIKKKLPDQKIR